ncbi:MAG: glycosyltransferase family 2 protein [Candidatus Hodarchaeota archaeon]
MIEDLFKGSKLIQSGKKTNVSIIIPVHNAELFLAETIESVRRQSYEDFELLLCEDGSHDRSLDICRSFVDRDCRVFLYRHPGGKNLGVSATRNLGIDKARGRFVAFLDADDLLAPESLSTRLRCFEKNPHVGLAFSAATVIDEKGNPSQFNGSSIFGQFGPIGIPSRFDSLLLEGNGICTSTVMVRRSSLGDLRFVKDVEFQYEDWLLWIELSTRCHFYQHSETLSRYRVHRNQAIGDDYFKYYRCCLYLYRRLVSMGWDSTRIRTIRNKLLFGLLQASLLRQPYGLPLHKLCLYFIVYLKNKERWDFWKLILNYLGQRFLGKYSPKQNIMP